MRRIATLLLISIVSILSIGTLDTIAPTPRPSRATPTPDAGWLASAQSGIAAREYQASVNRHGLQAPNRAQNLRTYFEPDGIRVLDRAAEEPTELLALRLERMGRAGSLEPVERGTVSHEGDRVEIRRPGLVEWYQNSPAGLEQGFTLDARPAGEGPLVLEIAVQGASASACGNAAAFESEGGRNFEYGKLAVFDAAGAVVAATMEVEERAVRLVVADQGAAYPIVIDPLLTATHDAQLSIAATAGAQWYGEYIDKAGDVNGDGYGDIIVGDPRYDGGLFNQGGAFVYLGSATGIANNAAPSTTLVGGVVGAGLGHVAGAGDVNGDGYSDVIVGALEMATYPGGAAFVFHGSASGIPSGGPADAASVVHSTVAGDFFGFCTSPAGDVNGDGYADVVIGAYGRGGAGAVYVFHGSATGITSGNIATANTTITSNQATSLFGYSCSDAGDVNGDGFDDIVVGAQNYDAPENAEGAVFVFHGSASGVPSGNQNSASDMVQTNQIGSLLGYSVAGAGDLNGDGYADIIAGAYGHDGAQTDAGAAFTFHGGPGGITSGATVSVAATTFTTDQNTARIAMVDGAGDVNGDGYGDIIVASPFYDLPEVNEGAAFVFLGGPSGAQSATTAFAYATLEANQTEARQYGACPAGDINGDGYADVMVSAYQYDGSVTNEGMARLYLGGSRGIISASQINAYTTLQSDQPILGSGFSARLGKSVASAGDVNGDGYSDVIVGAPLYDAGQTDEGAAFVFLGSPTGVASANPSLAATTLQADQASSYFGYSVAGAGDVNGDGYSDVIVGASDYDAGDTDEGAAFVFLGGPTGIANGNPSTAAATLQSNLPGLFLATCVAGAGDVNGDGFGDVLVGAPLYTAGESAEGAAFLFLGSAAGIANGDLTSASATFQSNQAGAYFGGSVAGAGDVNGDGYADVIVGAGLYDLGGTDEGAAFIFVGSAAGIASGNPGTAATTLQSDDPNARLGISVAAAGDVNGDGYGDVIVGADRYHGVLEYGAAFLFHGSPTGVANGYPASAATSIVVAQLHCGASVAGVGDVNGDGYADVMVAQSASSPTWTPRLYRGGPTGITTATFEVFPMTQGGSGAYGVLVAGAGDVNGDGFADVIIGVPLYDLGQTDEGAAFIFMGNGGRLSRPSRARQVRSDGSGAPVQQWGSSQATNRFDAGMTGVHPGGRGRVKVEVEACPPGAAFGSVGCTRTTSSDWSDVGAAPGGVVQFAEVAAAPQTAYRWRARTLRAPYSVTQPGITAPPNPAHGPWRRMQGQSVEGDVRTLPLTLAVEITGERGGLAIERLVNPARGSLDFTAVLAGPEPATFEVFDVAGRRMLVHDLPYGGAGRQTLKLRQGRDLSAGIYLLRLTQGGRAATARVVVVQ